MPNEIAEINRLLAQPGLDKSDIVNLMSQIRNLLEERHLKKKYAVLNLYCNWIFHTKIDQSMVCFRMLEELTDNILKHKDQSPNSAFFAGVSDTLAISELRNQMLAFCQEVSVSDTFCNDPNIWKGVFGMIAAILIDRPIQFPEQAVIQKRPNIKSIYDSVCRKVGNTSFGVKGFSFFVKGDGAAHDQGELWWKLDLIPSATAIPQTVALTGKLAWPK